MKSRLLIAVALAAMLGCAGCRTQTAANATNAPEAQRMVVAVARVHSREFVRTAQIQGALFPREKTVVAAETTGAVAQVVADFGDQVKKGQVLLRIDPREYSLRVDSAQAQLEQAQARLENAQANFDRTEELNREHLIAKQQYDQTQAALRVAEADAEAAENALGIAKKQLNDTFVRAPFAGSVQKRMVSLGEHVTGGTALYELIAIDPIKLRAPVPERYVPLVKIGLRTDLTVDARLGTVYTGTVTRVAPALDDTSRTLLLEAEVPNPDGNLKPGYFAHVTLNLGQDRALFVPQNGVLRYAGVARVFVLEGGVVHSREVTTGVVENGEIEIVKGLSEGEKIVVSDIDRLADGTAVIAKEQS